MDFLDGKGMLVERKPEAALVQLFPEQSTSSVVGSKAGIDSALEVLELSGANSSSLQRDSHLPPQGVVRMK